MWVRDRWWLLATLTLVMLACAVPIPTTEPLTVIDPVDQVETLGLQGSPRAVVRLRMLSGDFGLQPADDLELLEAHFHYNVAEWEPQITQTTQEFNTRIVVNQGIGSQLVLGANDYANSWDIRVARGVPVDLGVDLGTGAAEMELGGLALSDLGVTTASADLSLNFAAANPEPLGLLRVTAGTGDIVIGGLGNANFDRLSFTGGAGSVDLDFSGGWERAAIADIKAGAGEVTVRVPATLGVRVSFTGTSVTEVTTTGFAEQDAGVYVNPAYGLSPLTLTINLTSGIGSINLISQ